MQIFKENISYKDKKTNETKKGTNFTIVTSEGFTIHIKPTFTSDYFALLQIAKEKENK